MNDDNLSSNNKFREKWHSTELKDLIEYLETDENLGLTNEDVNKRINKYGLNEISEGKKRHPIYIFFEQFKDVLVIILIVALVISIIIGLSSDNPEETFEYMIDATAIFGIVIANALFGFAQEYKAEQSIEALKSMATQETVVVREGKKMKVNAKAIVPGDIINLEEGDRVPADCRLFQTITFSVDEASLTGESFPVRKESRKFLPEKIPLAERKNMIFSGTNAVNGRAQALVIETGMNTEFGRIAKGLMAEEKEETPLEKRLNTLGKWIGIASLAICFLIFTIGVLLNQDPIQMFIVAVGLAVAAVPEGLPAVVTLALAIGVQRMSKRNAIIRRLSSVETLGSTTVICSDKTGTLTQNKMIVRRIVVFDNNVKLTEKQNITEDQRKLLLIGKECNNAQLATSDAKSLGDPTELALLEVAKRMGVVEGDFKREFEIPFTSDSKRMSIIVKDEKKEKYYVYAKGAPDVLLNMCVGYLNEGNINEMDARGKNFFNNTMNKLAMSGYRLLGAAFKEVDKNFVEKFVLTEDIEEIESNLIFVGLSGMIDPARPGTKSSIEIANKAGIRSIMITGDHSLTARAIAKEIGLVNETTSEKVIEGIELEKMSDDELTSSIENVRVFARVSPSHKLRIVDALKRQNHIVAMTGDGVNDAPALKRADIGVAMGITGTDVSKEASDMILADDDYSTIVNAILEGRTIYDNMRKFILYLLSCNVGEILVMFVGMVITAILFEVPILPLLAIQILWVNLVTDGLPALAMGIDPPDDDIMNRKPRNPKEPIINRKSLLIIIYSGVVISIGTLFIFFFYLGFDKSLIMDEGHRIKVRSVTFTVLIIFQMLMALEVRTEEHSILGKEFIRNPYLLIAIASSISLHLLILYLPFFQTIFKTQPLQIEDWLLVLLVSSFIVISDELRKYLSKRIPRLSNIGGYW